nr:hypothetical protein [Clostridium botulinum]
MDLNRIKDFKVDLLYEDGKNTGGVITNYKHLVLLIFARVLELYKDTHILKKILKVIALLNLQLLLI